MTIMKHAYLILAHNEFQILETLIRLIDDERNDIYVHFDAKIEHLPKLTARASNLFILENRIRVFWGDASMIEAEYALMEEAFSKGDYSYFHLISGVDLPLKSQDYIHEFLKKNNGKEFIGYVQDDRSTVIRRKMQLYHLFSKEFRAQVSLLSILKRTIRYLFNELQLRTGCLRNRKTVFKQGPQWVTITNSFVCLLLAKKDEELKRYFHTYCADEFFMQTACWNSGFRKNIYLNGMTEFESCLRFIHWKGGELLPLEEHDFDKMMSSDAFFARKFSSENKNLIEQVYAAVGKKDIR